MKYNKHQLPETLADSQVARLFILSIMTSFSTVLSGNILLLSSTAAIASVAIWFASTAILLSLYMFYKITNNLPLSIVILSLIFITAIRFQIHFLVMWLYAVAPFGFFLLARDISQTNVNWRKYLLLSGVGSVTILAANVYISFDMLDRLHAGNVHIDTLYHASISSMLKSYGIVSTGINGLVETPYHILSHTIIAAISTMSGVSVLESYGIITYVLFIPLLLLVATNAVPNLRHSSLELSWLLVCFFLAIPPIILKRWAIWQSYFGSESYLLSLILLLSVLPLLTQKSLSIKNGAIIVLLSMLAGSAKISVGLFCLGLFFARLLFITKQRHKIVEVAIAAILVVGLLFVVQSAAISFSSSQNISIHPLHFIIEHGGGENALKKTIELINGEINIIQFFYPLKFVIDIILFFILHFLASWIVILWGFTQGGCRHLFSHPWVVFSLAAVGAGSIILLLFRIPGGSAYYFSNIAMFVSLPMLVSIVGKYIIRNRTKIPNWTPGVLVIVCLGLLFVQINRKSLLTRDSGVAQSLLIKTLIQVRENVPDNVVVKFVDTFNFQESNPVKYCMAQSFVLPATSERAWLGAIQDDEKCDYKGYGYAEYKDPKTGRNSRYFIPPEMMIRTLNKYGKVID